jgi:microsomal epoxide hydrolase
MMMLKSAKHPINRATRVGEKFLDWVDDPLPLETILDFVSLYWFTETYPRAIYFYREVWGSDLME